MIFVTNVLKKLHSMNFIASVFMFPNRLDVRNQQPQPPSHVLSFTRIKQYLYILYHFLRSGTIVHLFGKKHLNWGKF